jgi:hypothetical protein
MADDAIRRVHQRADGKYDKRTYAASEYGTYGTADDAWDTHGSNGNTLGSSENESNVALPGTCS